MVKTDWKKYRPYKKWLIVKADPRVKKTAGGIYLTDELTGIERVMEGTGRVLRVGSEVRDTVGFGIEPGHRIVYRGFLKDAFQGFEKEDDCDVFLLHAKDILAVIDDSVTMGEFQPWRENGK